MIKLQNLTVGYGSHAILSNLNLTLHAGRLVCLLGSNGAGKSTLLRTLAGFQDALNGEILLCSKKMSSLSLGERSKTVSVVLTQRVEVPYMKVIDLVTMGRSPYTGFFGAPSSEDKRLARDAIEQVGLTPLAERAIDTLSDGERQKVMIAKALAQQTPIILLDEPTAFLDFHAKRSTLRLLSRLAHEQNKAILLSTHDVEMALRLCDELWIVQENGIHTGTTAALTQKGILQQFLGEEEIDTLHLA